MIFTTETYGKWILCGEQAVLRGHPAIVFPLANYHLSLNYAPNAKTLEISSNQPELARAITAVWQAAWPHPQPGRLKIDSNIPCGQGMGASAALCLAIARCVYHFNPGQIPLWDFARNLENLFHGQSSGLDIIGVGSSGPQWFQNGKWHTIQLNWQPNWILTPTKELGQTAKAIQTVKQCWLDRPKFSATLDDNMQMATHLAKQALEQQNLTQLASSMRMAHDCFSAWGLITPKMQTIITELYRQGAIAVKPTGSGGGGFLLSLWEQSPKSLDLDDLAIILPNDSKLHLT